MIKKRKRLITLISSILTCTALCGLFALSSFRFKRQEETKADDVVVIYSSLINNTYTDTVIVSGQSHNRQITTYGSFNVNRVLDNGGMLYVVNADFTLSYNIDNSSVYKLIYGFYQDDVIHAQASVGLPSTFNLTYYMDTDNLIVFDFAINSENAFSFSQDFDFLYVSGSQIDMWDGYADVNDKLIVSMNIEYTSEDSAYDLGFQNGYQSGYNGGYNNGNINGYNQGYEQGVQAGKTEQSEIDQNLISSAYSEGYSEGYQHAESQDSTVTSIFNGITTVALVPVKFFLNIFNFEILGVNIASVVSALMSICLILIVWRAVMGGKSND